MFSASSLSQTNLSRIVNKNQQQSKLKHLSAHKIVDKNLTQLEQEIKLYFGDVRGDLPPFVPIGDALTQIRDRKLFKEKNCNNFGDYCKSIWKMSRNRAYQLINAAETYHLLENNNLDTSQLNEFQCRVLRKSAQTEEQQIIAYRNALTKVNEKKVTINSEILKYEVRRLQELVSRPPLPTLNTIVKLTSKFNIDIKEYRGYWGIVTELNEFSCNIRVPGAVLTNISSEDFMHINLDTQAEKIQALNLLERLDKILASSEIDRTVRNLIKEIASNPIPKLEEWQGYFIDTVERLLAES